MSARALGLIVTGGRHHVVSAEDLAFLDRTVRELGVTAIHTDGTEGVAAQVEAWARERGLPVWRVTANRMHDGPATLPERNTTLTVLARTVIAFPGDEITEDLLEKAKKRRLRIIETPGRKMAQRPQLDRPYLTPNQGPSHRAGISP